MFGSMKMLLLSLAACFSTVLYAQIPKDANMIIVKGVTFKEAINRLLDSNYSISKIDSNYQTTSTEYKQYSKGREKVSIHVRIKDSTAYITGTFRYGEKSDYMEGSLGWLAAGGDNPIANIKQWQKKQISPFTVLNNYALSFGKPVEYTKQ
jgi:hypothetical protein